MPTLAEKQCIREETTKWVWDRPLTFDQFLNLYTGRQEIVELVDGAVVEHMAAQLEHERLVVWLIQVLGIVCEERDLGMVLGSRTAVEITEFNGRLPDVVFVRRANLRIVQDKAIYGAPDLVIEVISPTDRATGRTALEADYRSIGVGEIVLIDLRRKRIRVLRKLGGDYSEDELESNVLRLESMNGIELPLNWMLDDSRPSIRQAASILLGESHKS